MVEKFNHIEIIIGKLGCGKSTLARWHGTHFAKSCYTMVLNQEGGFPMKLPDNLGGDVPNYEAKTLKEALAYFRSPREQAHLVVIQDENQRNSEALQAAE